MIQVPMKSCVCTTDHRHWTNEFEPARSYIMGFFWSEIAEEEDPNNSTNMTDRALSWDTEDLCCHYGRHEGHVFGACDRDLIELHLDH
jgi:hypothetical protein